LTPLQNNLSNEENLLKNDEALYSMLLQPDGSWYGSDMMFVRYSVNGQSYHCDDGPAMWPAEATGTGKVCWYLSGEIYSFEKWCERLNKTDKEMMLLKLQWV